MSRTAGDRQRGLPPHPSRDSSESGRWRIYDSHPDHIWNRLYRSLYLRVARDGREYGHDELDPLLWGTTKHLLGGPAYREAMNCLDQFLDTRAERLISDPLKRATLQRDLWAVFDWTAQRSNSPSQEVRELQFRLAKAIRRLALPAEQIRALPNTYDAAVAAKTFAADYDPSRPEAAFLPPELFQPGGPWVPLSVEGGGLVAPGHVASFSGRSVFQVFICLPQGREATLAYLKRVSEFPKPWVRNRRSLADVLPNPKLPQFPVSTRLALVRQMAVVDEQGNLTPTGIVESVQIRVHRTIPIEIPEGFNTDRNEARASLDVYEFRLSRAKLFAGDSGGMRAIARDEKEFPLFQSHGIDLFELQRTEHGSIERDLRPVLVSCSICHFRPGIHSVLSRMPEIVLLQVRDVRRNLIPSSDSAYEAKNTSTPSV
ncbi:MAG: hypothetical protein LC776_11770 [Acidobacteria bacterium]|nr:hypothetical protein [Acidobacteriota bacterium]